ATEEATSELLPAGEDNMVAALEISDLIRSKRLPAETAAYTLRQRIGHANPNVQLKALSLIDICVKNSGPLFLQQVASRTFMDDLVSIVNNPAGCHREVKERILELIQEWAHSFQSQGELGYVMTVYKRLKNEGHDFPRMDGSKVSGAMVDSATAPEWTDSDYCMRCRTTFTFTNRKHHCRNCGQTFCQACSSNNLPLPHYAIEEAVRVCNPCYLKLKK
ncbi:hypothetical protein GQ42DRAFT_112936, partial [Ramicandelaber brevisporus]